MHCDQNYKYIFSISCVCTHTLIQIVELTARGDTFVASIWRATLIPLTPNVQHVYCVGCV